jgi:hypothetical protein
MTQLLRVLAAATLLALFAAACFWPQRQAMGQQPNQEQLKKMEWIIGDWVHRGRTDDGQVVAVTRRYQWALEENYISCLTTVRVNRELQLAHRHMIGWDEGDKIFRSWVFSSNGDFVRGEWPDVQGDSRSGSLGGRTANGEQILARAAYTREGNDTLRYDVTEYTIGGEAQPDMHLTFRRVR